MLGKIITDDKGWLIETMMPLWDEPTLLVSRYRVMVLDGRPETAREPVRYSNGIWDGHGFRCGTDNLPPESIEKLPLKRPRGMKVWRDGEWRKS